MKGTSSTLVALCAVLSCAGMARATIISPKLRAVEKKVCEERKFIAQGLLELCLNENSGRMILGKMDTSATCTTNFNTALANADTLAATYETACRYVDNGDGTVSDLNTGLMWEQTTGTIGGTNTGDVNDVNNQYTWSSSGTAPDGTAFTSFLATLNNGISTDGGPSTPITGCFANHCDWRLPSIVELQGIVNTSDVPPIDPIFGPTQLGFGYWSTTTIPPYLVGVWYMDFNTGHWFGANKALESPASYVRAVRGGL